MGKDRTLNLQFLLMFDNIDTLCFIETSHSTGFPGGLLVENLPAKAGDVGYTGSILELERSPGAGSGNPLQYSCLGNPMNRGAWRGYSLWDRKRVGHDLATKQQSFHKASLVAQW